MVFFPTSSPTTGQNDYRRYMPPAYPGMINGMGQFRCYPCVHNVASVDTWTLTPPGTVDASTTYTVTINGVPVSFTTDASPTVAELMTGLYSQAVSSPQLYSSVEIARNTGTNVITITSRSALTQLSVITNSGDTTNDIVVANTLPPNPAPGNIASAIPLGRFVGRKADYYRDTLENVSGVTLINAASGYEVLGVTIYDGSHERTGRFHYAQEGYPFGSVMSVLRDTGTMKGVWIQTADADLAIGDAAYIAVAAGKEGMLTKSSSGTIDISSKVRIVSAAQSTFGGKYTALIELNL